MRALSGTGSLALTLTIAACVVGGCERDSRTSSSDTEASRPRPTPTPSKDVIGIASAPNGRFDGLATFVKAVAPQQAMMIAPQIERLPATLAGAGSLDGVDLDRPIHVVVLDPKRHSSPAVLVVAVSDADRLRAAAKPAAVQVRGKRALIGEASAIDAASKLGFELAGPVPAHPTLILYMQPLLASYHQEIRQAQTSAAAAMSTIPGGKSVGEMLALYVELFEAAAAQTERLEITLAADGSGLEITTAMVPVAGSTFAQFVAAQRPSQLSLASALPATGPIVFAGDIVAGSVRPAAIALFARLMTAMVGSDAALAERDIDQWLQPLTGEFAMAMDFGLGGTGMHAHYVMGVSDPEAAMRGWASLVQVMSSGGNGGAMGAMGMTQKVAMRLDVDRHDGVAIAAYDARFDTTGMDPLQAEAMDRMYPGGLSSHVAAFDDRLVMSMGGDSMAGVRDTIDVARGRKPAAELGPGVTAAFERSRQLKESAVMYFDLTAMLPFTLSARQPGAASESGMSLGIGFTGGAARMRFHLPARHWKDLTGAH